MKRMLRYLSFFLLVTSCTTIYYDQAQPRKVGTLTSFPIELRGWYIMDPDTFMIEKNHYSFPVVYEHSYSLAEIDTNELLKIKGDLFYDSYLPINEGVSYSLSGDSLHYKKQIRGSKFLSDSLVLKHFNDYFVLSELNKKSGYWTVMLLSEKEKNLVLKMNGKIKTNDDEGESKDYDGDLNEFSKICRFKSLDNSTFLIKPNKKQFNKLVEANLFSIELDLIRIENDAKNK